MLSFLFFFLRLLGSFRSSGFGAGLGFALFFFLLTFLDDLRLGRSGFRSHGGFRSWLSFRLQGDYVSQHALGIRQQLDLPRINRQISGAKLLADSQPAHVHFELFGDVAGKGLPAALLMAKLQSTLRALAVDEPSLAALGQKMNYLFCRDGLPNRFATLVYLEVTACSGSVRVLNAGHLPPIVLRGTCIEELPRGSMALGLMPEAIFSEAHVELADRDVLMVFSDGLTEAVNDRDEFFGDERLRARLPALAGLAARDLGTRVVTAVDEFVGDAKPHDDLSLIVLRRVPSA